MDTGRWIQLRLLARRGFVLAMLLFSVKALAENLLFSSDQWGNVNLHIKQSSVSNPSYLESILLKNPNFERLSDYSENDQLRQLSRPVGRLDVRLSGRGFMTCTGSLIATDKLLTNHHCVPGTGQYGRVTEARLLMGYYSEIETASTRWYGVDVVPLEANRANDYAILRVDGRPGDTWGTIRATKAEPHPGEALLLVHHPAGQPKHVTRGQCRTGNPTAILDKRLLHKCDTLAGSSGAPIFSADSNKALALHFAGAPPGAGEDRHNYG